MSTITVHHCPECEVSERTLADLTDHLQRDHHWEERLESSRDLAAKAELPTCRIAVALDPVHESAHAFETALTLAEQVHGELDLIATQPAGLDGHTTKAFLDAQRRRGDARGVRTQTTMLGSGDPADQILDYVAKDGDRPDLLVMDSKVKSALGEIVLGSVSESIVRRAVVPLLLTGPDVIPAEAFQRVVVGMDGSSLADAALVHGRRLAELLGVRVELIEVISPVVTLPPDIISGGYLARTSANFGPDGPDFDTAHGYDAAHSLVESASYKPGAIIAVGTHGRSPLRRLAMGSVALRVVRQATCPVLVIPPTVPEAAEDE